MSQLSQVLLQAAEDIRLSSPTEGAVEHLKQAGYNEIEARAMVDQHLMEKAATEAMVQAGVDVEQAVSMVKAAGVNLKDLVTYAPEVEEAHPSVDLLTKAAHYIEALEAEVEHLKEEMTAQMEKAAQARSINEIELPEPIAKAASVGAFTNEDLAELQKVDQGLLSKIASAMDEPWSMGSASGMARPKTDPLTEFLFS
jgi:hypothetical protein